jgi:hypothetical protein
MGLEVARRVSNGDLAGDGELAKMLQRLNGPEYQKLTDDLAASLGEVVKTDEQYVDLAFLLVLSRFPKRTESEMAIAHLKKERNRAMKRADIFWAIVNAREFMLGK